MTALMGLEARLRLARLFLRTDARQRQGDLPEFVVAALAGGVDVVLVQQDDLDQRTGREVLDVVRRLAATHQAVVGVVGAAAWAGAVRADLLHLGQPAEPTGPARRRLHPWALVGRSAHDVEQVAAAAADDGLDYFSVGPVRAAPADPGSDALLPALDLVRQAARLAPVFDVAARPWFATGGITADTLDAVLAAGARRVCVSAALSTADDPQDAAARLARPLADAWRADPAAERYRFAAAASRGRSR